MGAATKKSSRWPELFARYLVGEVNDEGEQRGYCPIHEDPDTSKSPSASFNFKKGVFYCAASCGGMSLSNLYKSEIQSDDEDDEPGPSSSRRGSVRSIDDAPSRRKKPLPSEDKIEQWTQELLGSPKHLKFMREERGLTVETIEKFELGWDGNRYTIPIRDAAGVLRNVRRYDPNARDVKMKVISWGTGWGNGRLYGLEVLEAEDEVIVTEGEMDRVLGAQEGLPTVTHTSGATTWKAEWSVLFEGKTVFFCYDRDKAGEQGAFKAAMSVSAYAKDVFLVKLPGAAKGFDMTDYFVSQGYTASDFRALMDESRKNPVGKKAKDTTRLDKKPKDVSLEQSMSSEHGRDPLRIVSTIAGKVQPAYMLPKRVDFICGGDWGDKCNTCPINARGNQHTLTIDAHEEVLLEFIQQNNDTVNKKLLQMVQAPHTCPRVDVEQVEQWNAEELVLVPSVDNRGEEVQNPLSRKVYNIGAFATPINTTASLVGVNTTDPKNQRAILQAWECEQTQTDIDRFQMDAAMRKRLSVFQTGKKEKPLDKMRVIAKDLALNVTRIYGRELLHLAYDVTWHSALNFNFLGKPVGKGWIELLVVGDTRTGKSEAASRLSDHYRSGVMKSCEGATLAGLVGGAQQIGNSWMVTWGTIPLNDRRLVILDEFSGIAEKNVIEQMSAVRSSGRAQITKVVSQETSARTRLIWISNPGDGRAMDEHAIGAIEAIRVLIKNPEDIARFDLAISAARADVESSVINSTKHEQVKHVFTTDLCNELVSWVWSRRLDQIVWDKGVEDYVLELSESFGSRFVPDPPLVQAENVRVKLARIAVAIAGRTFSCDETGELLVVTKEHVDGAVELLTALYGQDSFGYLQYSRKVLRDREQGQKRRKWAYRYLVQEDQVRRTLMSVLGQPFKVRDFGEFGGMQPREGSEAVVNLMNMKMIERQGKGYLRMTPALIEVLKRLEAELEE